MKLKEEKGQMMRPTELHLKQLMYCCFRSATLCAQSETTFFSLLMTSQVQQLNKQYHGNRYTR